GLDAVAHEELDRQLGRRLTADWTLHRGVCPRVVRRLHHHRRDLEARPGTADERDHGEPSHGRDGQRRGLGVPTPPSVAGNAEDEARYYAAGKSRGFWAWPSRRAPPESRPGSCSASRAWAP